MDLSNAVLVVIDFILRKRAWDQTVLTAILAIIQWGHAQLLADPKSAEELKSAVNLYGVEGDSDATALTALEEIKVSGTIPPALLFWLLSYLPILLKRIVNG
jgi:hypothetical protein